MSVSVVLLTCQEAKNLKILLPQIKNEIRKCDDEFEIIVIDTAKPLDNTKDVCEEYGVKYFNQEEPCFGGAFRTGIKYASMEKFLILDSDGSHNPKYIPNIYNIFTGADVAIGSRYVNGGVTTDACVSRLMSWILNTIFRLCLNIKARDISTDFRMYHTDALKKVNLSCQHYDILQEVLLKLKINKPNLLVAETPIVFNKRLYGESKRRLLPFIFSYLKTLIRLVALRFKLYCLAYRGIGK